MKVINNSEAFLEIVYAHKNGHSDITLSFPSKQNARNYMNKAYMPNFVLDMSRRGNIVDVRFTSRPSSAAP